MLHAALSFSSWKPVYNTKVQWFLFCLANSIAMLCQLKDYFSFNKYLYKEILIKSWKKNAIAPKLIQNSLKKSLKIRFFYQLPLVTLFMRSQTQAAIYDLYHSCSPANCTSYRLMWVTVIVNVSTKAAANTCWFYWSSLKVSMILRIL